MVGTARNEPIQFVNPDPHSFRSPLYYIILCANSCETIPENFGMDLELSTLIKLLRMCQCVTCPSISSVADLQGKILHAPSRHNFFFIFMQFSRKFGQKYVVTPLPLRKIVDPPLVTKRNTREKKTRRKLLA